MNVKAISKNVGSALLVSALFMLVSAGLSWFDGKDSAFAPLLISGVVTAIVGLFPHIFVRKSQIISLQDGFVIIVLSWLLSFIFGMLPYVMWGGEMSMADAWFESVSGFTTTGATILNDIEALPRSLLLWRSSTHFIGGLGVVVFMLLVIPSASPFSRRITKIEASSLSKEGYQIQNQKLVKIIATVYISIFFASTLSLFLCGMPLFDAVNHGFSLCATGGFSTRNDSIAAYNSPLINMVTVIFMILATTNFVLLYTCALRRSIKPIYHNKMVRFYLVSVIVMSAIVIVSLKFQGDGLSWKDALQDGFYTTVSYVTTTGFGFTDNGHWPFLACLVLMYASIQCATAGSTSSGIKADRMLVVFRSIGRQINSFLHPNSTRRIKIADNYLPDEQVLPVVLYIVLYFIIIGLSTILLLMVGTSGVEAVSGSIACLGNVGPALGNLSATGNYDSVSVAAKFIYTIDMFLGRIEIYPLLIAVSLIFRRSR